MNDAKDKYKEFIGGFFLGGLNFRSKVWSTQNSDQPTHTDFYYKNGFSYFHINLLLQRAIDMISDIKSDLLHEEYDQSKSKLKFWLNGSPEVRLIAILEQKNICKLCHFILSQTKFIKIGFKIGFLKLSLPDATQNHESYKKLFGSKFIWIVGWSDFWPKVLAS